jgi:hypothetical protein
MQLWSVLWVRVTHSILYSRTTWLVAFAVAQLQLLTVFFVRWKILLEDRYATTTTDFLDALSESLLPFKCLNGLSTGDAPLFGGFGPILSRQAEATQDVLP